jgi:hypothetical protein
MSLQLPEFSGLKPLRIGEKYRWELVLICNALDRSADIGVTANIERIPLNPTLESQLKQATPENQVVLYAGNRLWPETLKTLTDLRRNSPNNPNLNDGWNQLLKSVGLNNIPSN